MAISKALILRFNLNCSYIRSRVILHYSSNEGYKDGNKLQLLSAYKAKLESSPSVSIRLKGTSQLNRTLKSKSYARPGRLFMLLVGPLAECYSEVSVLSIVDPRYSKAERMHKHYLQNFPRILGGALRNTKYQPLSKWKKDGLFYLQTRATPLITTSTVAMILEMLPSIMEDKLNWRFGGSLTVLDPDNNRKVRQVNAVCLLLIGLFDFCSKYDDFGPDTWDRSR